MNRRRMRTLFDPRGVAVASLCALAMTGCGSGETPSAAPPTQPSTPAAPAAPATPAALPLDQRVVPGDLAGLSSPKGVQAAASKEAYVENQTDRSESDYAQERAGDIAKLADKGFVAGASKVYTGGEGSRGLSVVAQLGSPAQAKAYEQALYSEEFPSGVSRAGKAGTVAGAETSHTVIDTVTEDDEKVSHAWASFADGPFVYVVEAESEGAALNSQGVLDAASALFTKVKGAPVA